MRGLGSHLRSNVRKMIQQLNSPFPIKLKLLGQVLTCSEGGNNMKNFGIPNFKFSDMFLLFSSTVNQRKSNMDSKSYHVPTYMKREQ